MSSPKTADQLARAVEALLASYVDEGRRAAQAALEQTFSSTGTGHSRRRKGKAAESSAASNSAGRRSSSEIAAVADRLCELVRAHPGESMAVFAKETGLRSEELLRPMAMLKAEGRVRRVGARNMTRYFPGVGRRSTSSDR